MKIKYTEQIQNDMVYKIVVKEKQGNYNSNLDGTMIYLNGTVISKSVSSGSTPPYRFDITQSLLSRDKFLIELDMYLIGTKEDYPEYFL